MWTVRCTTLKTTKRVNIFEKTDFYNFLKTRNFRKLNTDFENRTKRPAETKACILLDVYPLGHTLQSKFIPFYNQTFPLISLTSGLSAKIKTFSNTVFTRKEIFPKMFQSLLMYGSIAPESSLQSDQKWSLQRGTKVSALKSPLHAMRKSQCISSWNCVDKTSSPKIPKLSVVLLNYQ